MTCPACGGPLPGNEAAAYGGRCEDCYGVAMAAVFEERNVRATLIPKTGLGGPRTLAQHLAASRIGRESMDEARDRR